MRKAFAVLFVMAFLTVFVVAFFAAINAEESSPIDDGCETTRVSDGTGWIRVTTCCIIIDWEEMTNYEECYVTYEEDPSGEYPIYIIDYYD